MRLDPPLDPTSPEARTWLENELSKGIYRDDRSLLERLQNWLMELLSSTGSGSLPAWSPWPCSPSWWRVRCGPSVA